MGIEDFYSYIAIGIFVVLTIGMLYFLNSGNVHNLWQAYNSPEKNKTTNSTPSELRWEKMPLSYKIYDEDICGVHEINRIVWGFNQIENETNGILSFVRANGTTDIIIYCNESVPSPREGYVTQGEASYKVENGFIKDGEIFFFNTGPNKYSMGCLDYPDTEIHEILHVFGFVHNETDKTSIMYPEHLWCSVDKFRIDKYILDKIKEVYG